MKKSFDWTFVNMTKLFCIFFWAAICFSLNWAILNKISEEDRDSFLKANLMLEEKLESYIHGLQGMGGFVMAKNYYPTIQEIRNYAKFRNFFNNFPGALGFGFVRLVKQNELIEFVSKKEAENKNFKFKQLHTHRDDAYIIESIEPIENNLNALGLDIGSEKFRRSAANKSRDEGIAALTAPIELVQVHGKGKGFLFFYPVYDIVNPQNLKERRDHLIGWSYTPILAEEIIRHLDARVSKHLKFHISDITDEHKPLNILDQIDDVDEQEKTVLNSLINIGTRTWKFTAISLNHKTKWVVNIFSFVFFILGSMALFSFFNRYKRFKIEKDTVESDYKSIESWRKSVLDGANYALIAVDTDGVINIFNKAAERMLGYSAEEVVGKLTPAILLDEQEIVSRTIELEKEFGIKILPGIDTFITKPKQTDKPETKEWTCIAKDGRRFPVRLSINLIKLILP